MEALEESLGGELTVERVRREVKALSENIQAKQTEIQLIVGSRYHELIESADAVLGMYKSCKKLQHTLRTTLPPTFGTLATATHPRLHLRPWQETAAAAVARQHEQQAEKGAFPLTRQDVQLLLHAPTRLWEAMDAGQFLTAATLWADAKGIADKTEAQAQAAREGHGRKKWTPTQWELRQVVRQQWAYLEDLQGSITAGAHALLRDQDVGDTRQHALALVALSRLEPSLATPAQALQLFVERRGQWLEAALRDTEAVDGDAATVQVQLSRAVQALWRTVLDAHRIFVVEDKEEKEMEEKEDGEALQPLRQGRAAMAEALTGWVGGWLVEIHGHAQRLLRTLKSSNELASVRQALWVETHGFVSSSLGGGSGAIAQEENEPSNGSKGLPTLQAWRDACHAVLSLDKLRLSLQKAGLPLTLLPWEATGATTTSAVGGGGLDLWGLLFSDSFATLVEDLLWESMSKIRLGFINKFESILSVLRTPSSSSTPFSSSSSSSSSRFTAVEMSWAAEHLLGFLLGELRHIQQHAANDLVQEGDAVAAAALGASLQAQALRLLAQLSSFLRTWVRGLEGGISHSSSSSSSSSSPPKEDLDALLIIARFTSLLLAKAPGTVLRLSAGGGGGGKEEEELGMNTSKSKYGKKKGGGGGGGVAKTIDKVQLESAFTIADARGQGELTPEELQEALDTLGLSAPSSSSFSSSSSSYPATLAEVSLLCSSVLEDSQPTTHLTHAYGAIYTSAVSAWAKHVAHPLGQVLKEEGVGGLVSGSKDDSAWRAHRPGWEEKVSAQEDESGRVFEDRMWVPTLVSPPVSVFLFALASELGRVTRSQDATLVRVDGPGEEKEEEGRKRGISSSISSMLQPRKTSSSLAPPPPSSVFSPTTTTILESFRAALVREARLAVEAAYTHTLKVDALGENAVLQAVLDLHFLRQWLGHESGAITGPVAENLPWLGGPLRALVATVDPINYEAFEPFVREAVHAYNQGYVRSWLGCVSALHPLFHSFIHPSIYPSFHPCIQFIHPSTHSSSHPPKPPNPKTPHSCALIVSHLCCAPGTSGVGGLGHHSRKSSLSSLGDLADAKAGGGGGGGGSNKALPLVPAVPRFTLLPVVVDATTPAASRLSPMRAGKSEQGSGLSSFSFSDMTDVGVGGVAGGGKARVGGAMSGGASAAASVVGSAASNVLSSLFGAGRR